MAVAILKLKFEYHAQISFLLSFFRQYSQKWDKLQLSLHWWSLLVCRTHGGHRYCRASCCHW